ncbi:MAG: mismatch-specific DNA-glycosylase [Chthonomonadales bacterium]|nr:mismatch-specific DNA-glycosylase [Chthonomonadales bacterium]
MSIALRAPEPLLPDILAPDLDVVFIGAAPSPCAARLGHYYAGRGNRFWQLLFQAGLTPRELDASEDSTVLRYGIGLTAILPQCISTMNCLLPPPTDEDRAALFEKLRHYGPRILCYNGKDVYRMCMGEADPPWGLQSDDFDGMLTYVVHSSSGRADRWAADRLLLYRELGQLVRGLAR